MIELEEFKEKIQESHSLKYSKYIDYIEFYYQRAVEIMHKHIAAALRESKKQPWQKNYIFCQTSALKKDLEDFIYEFSEKANVSIEELNDFVCETIVYADEDQNIVSKEQYTNLSDKLKKLLQND